MRLAHYLQVMGLSSAHSSQRLGSGLDSTVCVQSGGGGSSVEAWFSTAMDIEEVLSRAGGDQLHVMVPDVVKSFDTVDWFIMDCALRRLGYLLVWKSLFFFS